MDLVLVALGRKSPPVRCGFGKGLRNPRSEESCPRPSRSVKSSWGWASWVSVCSWAVGGVLVGFLGKGRLRLCRRRADGGERHHRARDKLRGPNVEPQGAHFLGSGVALVGVGN